MITNVHTHYIVLIMEQTSSTYGLTIRDKVPKCYRSAKVITQWEKQMKAYMHSILPFEVRNNVLFNKTSLDAHILIILEDKQCEHSRHEGFSLNSQSLTIFTRVTFTVQRVLDKIFLQGPITLHTN